LLEFKDVIYQLYGDNQAKLKPVQFLKKRYLPVAIKMHHLGSRNNQHEPTRILQNRERTGTGASGRWFFPVYRLFQRGRWFLGMAGAEPPGDLF
jgi:hypothetical protein